MIHRRWFIALFLSCFAIASPAIAEFAGKVIGVSDGDTMTVLRDRSQVRIRLYGIDCPETGQDFGSRAKQFTADLAFGKVVKVVPRDRDRTGGSWPMWCCPMAGCSMMSWSRRASPGGIVTMLRISVRCRNLRRKPEKRSEACSRSRTPSPPWEWRKTKGEALPGEFIGNRRTHVYHGPGCPNAASISPGNRMPFNSAGAAEAAGFRPGKDCLNR